MSSSKCHYQKCNHIGETANVQCTCGSVTEITCCLCVVGTVRFDSANTHKCFTRGEYQFWGKTQLQELYGGDTAPH